MKFEPETAVLEDIGNEIADKIGRLKNKKGKILIRLSFMDPRYEEEGDINDVFYESLFDKKILVLDKFKKDKAIVSYTFKPDPENDYIYIDCHLKPIYFLAYLKKSYERKITFYKTLSPYISRLIQILEPRLNPPFHKNEELNDSYMKITKEIDVLLQENSYLQLYSEYKNPFNDLFSIEKELAKNSLSPKDIINDLNAFYGKIHKMIVFYDIEKEPFKLTEDAMRSIDKSAIFSLAPEMESKNFNGSVLLQRSKNKAIQLHKFPLNLQWEEISIQFLNEHDVIIKARNEVLQTTYEMMGFQDEKRKLPNKQWGVLRLLSFKEGEISWENNRDLSLQKINSIKKQKQLLTEALKKYFQIYNIEPFYDYKKEKAYRIKLRLISDPES